MAVATKLTWEEFEKLPDDGWHHELLEGEHIALAPPRFDHSETADRILTLLRRQTQRKAYVEAGYRLGADSWVQPGVSTYRVSNNSLDLSPAAICREPRIWR